MTIKVGDKSARCDAVCGWGANGPEEVRLADRLAGRKVAIFAVPGAFTPTCHSAHMPSFVRNVDAFRAKGVDEIICISVNDAHVMRCWGEATGATAAGITLLADTDEQLQPRRSTWSSTRRRPGCSAVRSAMRFMPRTAW